jgi:hyperosmotically inducible periplasmic protein
MKKLFLTSFIVMALGLALMACAPADPLGSTSKPATIMTDSELETRIKAALNTDAQLKAVDLNVSADADKNEATISGEVWTQSMRAKAVNLAKEAIPGLVLNDKIEVKPRELTREEFTQERASEVRGKAQKMGDKLGDSIDDAWIHTKLVAKFLSDDDTPGRKINVDVVNNVVTLRGAVATAEQRAEAERIARNTDGVKRVVNQLKVAGKPAR